LRVDKFSRFEEYFDKKIFDKREILNNRSNLRFEREREIDLS
jgi:hypothetical protein